MANHSASIKVWDLPVRLVHWSITALVAVSWLTAEVRWMEIHKSSGYLILALTVFRVGWGFFGSEHARFKHFVRGLGAALSYLRGLRSTDSQRGALGHNPVGGWSVLVLLSLLLLQPVIGLFVVDVDGLESGPLASWVSFDTGRWLAAWHEEVFDILSILIAIHIAAVLFYLVCRRENLIAPMITGRKQLPRDD